MAVVATAAVERQLKFSVASLQLSVQDRSNSEIPQKLRKLQIPQLQFVTLAADLRERSAECAENSANSAKAANSEWFLYGSLLIKMVISRVAPHEA